MVPKEMEKILVFDYKYVDGVKKRKHRRLLYKNDIFKLRVTMAAVTEREKCP